MKVAREVIEIGRQKILMLTAESFEEERILNALEITIKAGGTITIENDMQEMTARFKDWSHGND